MPIRRGYSDVPTLAETFAGLKADYAAAKSSRFRRRRTGVHPMGSGHDYHYRSEADYLRMMEYARDFDRNDTVVGATVDKAVTNTIQDGIQVDPQTGDQGLDAELKARWIEWGEDPEQCDRQGEMTFWDMEQFALRHGLVDGDLIALPTRDGTVQMAEAHRMRTPSGASTKRAEGRALVHGVLLDQYRRRLGEPYRARGWLGRSSHALERLSDQNSERCFCIGASKERVA